MKMGGYLHALAALHPEKNPGTHRIGGLLGSRACLDGFEEEKNLYYYQNSNSGPSNPQPCHQTDNTILALKYGTSI
jgi:hypothetical protein